MQLIKYPKRRDWEKILQRPSFRSLSLEKKVKKILEAVKTNGDKAVRDFTEAFDGVKLKNLSASKAEIADAGKLLSEDLKQAIIAAKKKHREISCRSITAC